MPLLVGEIIADRELIFCFDLSLGHAGLGSSELSVTCGDFWIVPEGQPAFAAGAECRASASELLHGASHVLGYRLRTGPRFAAEGRLTPALFLRFASRDATDFDERQRTRNYPHESGVC